MIAAIAAPSRHGSIAADVLVAHVGRAPVGRTEPVPQLEQEADDERRHRHQVEHLLDDRDREVGVDEGAL